MAEVLEVEGLQVRYLTPEGEVKAVNSVSFSLQEGAVLCLVGESGAGKSTIALSLLGLLPDSATVVGGKAYFKGMDLLHLTSEELRDIRGKEISIVFQDPRAALNPVVPIGTQVEEIILAHTPSSRKQAKGIAQEMLSEMGLPDPDQIFNRYPFQISGGMCQRVMLSIALALHPKVLIADEPTSNLDVTLQAEILDRMKKLCKELNSALLLITHDMGVVAHMADKVAMLYGGTIVEYTDVSSLFEHPYHPYTWGLFQSLPRLDDADLPLRTIRGSPPDMINLPAQCPYLDRCPKAVNRCHVDPRPPLADVEPGHQAACYNIISYDRDNDDG